MRFTFTRNRSYTLPDSNTRQTRSCSAGLAIRGQDSPNSNNILKHRQPGHMPGQSHARLGKSLLIAVMWMLSLLSSPLVLAVLGDENWDDQFFTSNLNGRVLATVIDGAGNLYVGGDFTTAGGISANYIAQWDGSNWSALGSGMNGAVEPLAIDSGGALFAGGNSSTAGNKPSNHIARWALPEMSTPVPGSTVWLRLWHKSGISAPWQFIDASFIASSDGPMITSPSSADVLGSPTESFSWIDPAGSVTEWWLYAGSSAGGQPYENSANLGADSNYTTSQTLLPTGSVPVYVRLWYKIGVGSWLFVDQVFTSAL